MPLSFGRHPSSPDSLAEYTTETSTEHSPSRTPASTDIGDIEDVALPREDAVSKVEAAGLGQLVRPLVRLLFIAEVRSTGALVLMVFPTPLITGLNLIREDAGS